MKKYIKSIHILKFHQNSILLTYKEGKIIIFDIKSKRCTHLFNDNYGSWYTEIYEIDNNRIIVYKSRGKRSIIVNLNNNKVRLLTKNIQYISFRERKENGKVFIEMLISKRKSSFQR